MVLFPSDFIDILAQEIETWKGFADTLRGEDRSLFLQMLEQCYQYERAINSCLLYTSPSPRDRS